MELVTALTGSQAGRQPAAEGGRAGLKVSQVEKNTRMKMDEKLAFNLKET